MTEDKNAENWVYVFICKSDNEENYLGLYNKEQDVNFIPAFQTKDDANDCFLNIPREKGKRYEVQAVHIEELHENASNNNFVVALVDKEGRIIK